MARCRCAEGACGCAVEAGVGTTVTGTGTAKDPWVINAADQGHIAVADTPTLDLNLLGNGTSGNPYLLSGNVLGGTGTDEVWIGTTDPIVANPTIELWFYPDAVSGLPRLEEALAQALARITTLEAQVATLTNGKGKKR